MRSIRRLFHTSDLSAAGISSIDAHEKSFAAKRRAKSYDYPHNWMQALLPVTVQAGNEASFFEDLETCRRGLEEAKVARALLDWSKQTLPDLSWGKGGQDGSFIPSLEHEGFRYTLFSVWTYGRLEVQLKR